MGEDNWLMSYFLFELQTDDQEGNLILKNFNFIYQYNLNPIRMIWRLKERVSIHLQFYARLEKLRR